MQRGVRSVKSNYCNRKPFWTCMQRLIDKGYTEAAAMAKIKRVYTGSVTRMSKMEDTDILNQLSHQRN